MGRTTITLKTSTKQRLGSHGEFNESWDQVVNQVLDDVEHGTEDS